MIREKPAFGLHPRDHDAAIGQFRSAEYRDSFLTDDTFSRSGTLRICALRRNRFRINFDIFP
jgi:hypothetical protein